MMASPALPIPFAVKDPCRAHSIEMETNVHNVNALKMMTNAAGGMASPPSVMRTNGKPSRTLFEKIPPIAKIDCETPSRANALAAIQRPAAKTTKQPPKNATSTLGLTSGISLMLLIR
jgi:hypothetical protein